MRPVHMEKQESSLRRRSTEPSARALSAPSGCPHHWPYIRVASFRSLDCLLKDVVYIYIYIYISIIHIIHIELVHIKYIYIYIILYIQACLYIVFYTRTQHTTFVSDKKHSIKKGPQGSQVRHTFRDGFEPESWNLTRLFPSPGNSCPEKWGPKTNRSNTKPGFAGCLLY